MVSVPSNKKKPKRNQKGWVGGLSVKIKGQKLSLNCVNTAGKWTLNSRIQSGCDSQCWPSHKLQMFSLLAHKSTVNPLTLCHNCFFKMHICYLSFHHKWLTSGEAVKLNWIHFVSQVEQQFSHKFTVTVIRAENVTKGALGDLRESLNINLTGKEPSKFLIFTFECCFFKNETI